MISGWLWLAWAVGVLSSFGVMETVALRNRRGYDTLTATTRRVLGIYPVRPLRRVTIPLFAATLLVFIGWFIPHIIAGWWGGNGAS